MLQFFYGLILSFAVAILAYKKKSLTLSGLIAAVIYGTSLYLFGGLFFFTVMIFFFISSSLLSKFKNKEKEICLKINDKGGNRDYTQVIANGLPSFVFAWLYFFTKSPAFILGFGTSLAAANADTWASELGVLSKKKPVSIVTGKVLTSGMSGGITAFGTAASFLGGLLISTTFVVGYNIKYPNNGQATLFFLFCLLGGFLGSIIDSILGATIQGIFWNESTGMLSENRYSSDENKLIKGCKYINNNLVNLFSVSLAAILAILGFLMIS